MTPPNFIPPWGIIDDEVLVKIFQVLEEII